MFVLAKDKKLLPLFTTCYHFVNNFSHFELLYGILFVAKNLKHWGMRGIASRALAYRCVGKSGMECCRNTERRFFGWGAVDYLGGIWGRETREKVK